MLVRPPCTPLYLRSRGTNGVTFSRQLLRVITRKEHIVSVETQLGLHDKGNGLLAHAGQNWTGWTDRFPCLSGIGGVGSLRGWLRAAEPVAADEVLHALVTLASPSGGDDASAAAMVAWALSLVWRLRAGWATPQPLQRYPPRGHQPRIESAAPCSQAPARSAPSAAGNAR